MFSSPRRNSGGVGVYISTHFNFCNVQQNWIGSEHCEDIWLSVEDRRTNQFFNIVVLYRHPNTNIPEFISKLDEVFCNPILTNRCTYILGDINIDICTSNRSTAAQEYINVLTCKGFFSIITKPTRVTETSATIIDHIITNDLTRRLFPIILRTDLTDRYLTAVVATINIKRKQRQSGKILRRDMSHFSTENFNNDVEQFADRFLEDLTEITAENFNNVFDYFTNFYKRIVDQHAPIKCLSRKKQRLQNKPWISKGILISIRNKQKMYKTHFLQGSNVFKVIYKTYANKLTKVKSLAKKLYIAREFSNCKGDGRKMWEAVKTLIPSNSTKKSKATPSELRIDGSLIQNPKTYG